MLYLPRARFTAPALHAILFAAASVLFFVSVQPVFPGPATLLFVLLFFADLPVSALAFLVSHVSKDSRLVWGLWGIAGTFWWYLLGVSIERWKHLLSRTSER